MNITEISFVGGVLLGLASSLHCAVMCGGISSGLLFLFDTSTIKSRVRVLALAQTGRLIAYIFMGSLLGGLGAQLFTQMRGAETYRILQWAGAVTLMWIGLSTAGVVPALSAFDRLFSPISRIIARGATQLAAWPAAPIVMGAAWGFMPCAMVYGALFTAALTSSFQGGALVMAGFGFGTLPAVTATAFGIRSLVAVEARPVLRSLLGLAVAVTGFLTVYVSQPAASPICQ